MDDLIKRMEAECALDLGKLDKLHEQLGQGDDGGAFASAVTLAWPALHDVAKAAPTPGIWAGETGDEREERLPFIFITIRREELAERRGRHDPACDGGQALFDQLAGDGDSITIRWDALTAIWAAKLYPGYNGFAGWTMRRFGLRISASGADLSGAYLREANLRGAYLRGADLSGANLSGAYLSGAYLSGADLSGADLRGAYLREADLRGAYLREANLRGADLSGAYRFAGDPELVGWKRNDDSRLERAEVTS